MATVSYSFLKSLQTVEHIYDSTLLADSILSLGALRTRLEFEIGRSAESILGLFSESLSIRSMRFFVLSDERESVSPI